MDEDLETLIEGVKQTKPELAEAMREIEAQVKTEVVTFEYATPY